MDSLPVKDSEGPDRLESEPPEFEVVGFEPLTEEERELAEGAEGDKHRGG